MLKIKDYPVTSLDCNTRLFEGMDFPQIISNMLENGVNDSPLLEVNYDSFDDDSVDPMCDIRSSWIDRYNALKLIKGRADAERLAEQQVHENKMSVVHSDLNESDSNTTE